MLKKSKKSNKKEQSANEMINVCDIKGSFLYTLDGYIIMYLKINPISIDLFSEREKKNLCKMLTAELSSENKPFKFLAVSRPVDISPLINEYTNLIVSTTNQKRKDLLKNEMLVLSNYALSRDVGERKFYIMIWEKPHEDCEHDISKRSYELMSKFESAGIMAEILKQQEIVRLCNIINNPAYIQLEDASFEAVIPIVG